jgi:hypothetical protein
MVAPHRTDGKAYADTCRGRAERALQEARGRWEDAARSRSHCRRPLAPGAPELFRLDRDPAEAENLADETLEAKLQRDVVDLVGSLKRPEPSAPPPMSDEVRKRQKALGYVN